MSNKIETTNGVNINVEDLAGTGNPVVFIHGWPVNYNMFEYQFTELPKHGYRCIGIDLRGFGDSDKPNIKVQKGCGCMSVCLCHQPFY